eukprot:SAG31_NODE_13813_length_845_cov_0.754692_1_plen_104_part_10
MSTKACFGWDTPWSLNSTMWYEVSYIHPRAKLAVGTRLASAALALYYDATKQHTLPVLSGCALSADGVSLTISFNASLLGDDELQVHSWNRSQHGASAMEVKLA